MMPLVKHKCVQCGIETAATYKKNDGTGPLCYPCMQNTGEFPAIIYMGDGTEICAKDKYLVSRHTGDGFYLDDRGRKTKCGTLPSYDTPQPQLVIEKSSDKAIAIAFCKVVVDYNEGCYSLQRACQLNGLAYEDFLILMRDYQFVIPLGKEGFDHIAMIEKTKKQKSKSGRPARRG